MKTKTKKKSAVLSGILILAVLIMLWCIRDIKLKHSWLPFSKGNIEQKK